MDPELPFLIRTAKPSDMPFIEHAWRSTLLASAFPGADPMHFHREMTQVFKKILPTSTIRVACDPKDPDTLVGFVCFTGPELHYVYVSGPFRKLGIVPALLANTRITRFTFKTGPGDRRLKPRTREWIFTPRFTL